MDKLTTTVNELAKENSVLKAGHDWLKCRLDGQMDGQMPAKLSEAPVLTEPGFPSGDLATLPSAAGLCSQKPSLVQTSPISP